MTIDKAIEILPDLIPDLDNRVTGDYSAALKLGIEALKRHKLRAVGAAPELYPPLPGETKD
ncbi:hypothetical protein ES703_125076 [subsurface metagenome]